MNIQKLNIKVIIVSLLLSFSILSAKNFTFDTQECYTRLFEPINLEKQPSRSFIKKIGLIASKTTTFGFNNYDKILSKKFIAALIIVGSPYLYYTDTDVLEKISEYACDFTFKMSEAVAGGIMSSIIKNPIALAKIIAIMTAGQTSKKIASALSSVILKVITLGFTGN